jgi:hypothetical protein
MAIFLPTLLVLIALVGRVHDEVDPGRGEIELGPALVAVV